MINNSDIITIPEKNIYMEFDIDNIDYIAFFTDNTEYDNKVYFAKYEGNYIKSIKEDSEYKRVVKEFERRLSLISETDDEEY